MRGSRSVAFLCLISVLIPGVARAAAATDTKPSPEAASPEETEAEPAKPKVPAKVPAPASLPYRLGLFYAHAFGQSGDLTRMVTQRSDGGVPLPSPSVVGLDIGIGAGSHIRYHFAVSVEWESQTNYAARGFRFDPVTLGFPILIWRNDDVAIHIEPLVHLIRGEILSQSVPKDIRYKSQFRIESGFAGAISAVSHHWFLAVEPISLDFRVFEANNQWVHTGFSQLWWFQVTAGHEF
jgi:hypothetical protein